MTAIPDADRQYRGFTKPHERIEVLHPADEEVRLLHARHPSVKKDLLRCLVAAASDLRRAHANEVLTTLITTRRLLALCARLERGNDFPRALQVCVLNKVPQEDSRVIRETFDHHVGLLGQSAETR